MLFSCYRKKLSKNVWFQTTSLAFSTVAGFGPPILQTWFRANPTVAPYHAHYCKNQTSLAWITGERQTPGHTPDLKLCDYAMIVTFFDCRGIILKHWVPHRQIITAAYYIEVLKMWWAIARKWPELWASHSWLLHYDNTTAHSASATWQFLMKTCTTVLEHCGYSPDLAPNDFFLYAKTKEVLKGADFQSKEVMKAVCEAVMNSLEETDFQECFQASKSRVEKCIRAGGEYIEGCHV